MKFLFDDESFSFETLRTAGFAAYGGADLGEVLTTASHIGEGDEASWHQAWKATAQRVAEIGEHALGAGHRVSAREALLRASNYYRTAGAFLLEQPATDPEMTLLSAGQCDTFAAAAALFDTPVEAVVTPVVDYALTRGEIVPDEIVLFGYSLGGYLVARAAAFEHRVAALILDDGIHDFHAAFAGSLPPFIGSWIEEGRDDVAVPVLT